MDRRRVSFGRAIRARLDRLTCAFFLPRFLLQTPDPPDRRPDRSRGRHDMKHKKDRKGGRKNGGQRRRAQASTTTGLEPEGRSCGRRCILRLKNEETRGARGQESEDARRARADLSRGGEARRTRRRSAALQRPASPEPGQQRGDRSPAQARGRPRDRGPRRGGRGKAMGRTATVKTTTRKTRTC